MLTNFRTVRASIKRLKELEEMEVSKSYEKINKKEILQLSRERNKLDKTLGGIKEMGGLPDVLFVIDVGYENIAVLEANKLGIPVVGIVDTNNSPDQIDYIVPGNDDSMRAIKLYTRLAADAIVTGKESIVVVSDSDDEMIELESEDAKIPAKPAVKITSRKPAPAAVQVKATGTEAVEPEPGKPQVIEAKAVEAAQDQPESEEAPVAATAPKKAAAKKAAPKKAAPKKAAIKKAATKKAAPKKAAPKKAASKKAATKKAATKKAASKKATSD